MSDVLITYGWVRSSYAALRNLKKHNISVAIADTSSSGMCQYSKFKDSFDTYHSHYKNEEKFISDIKDICSRRGIKYIMPSHNETEIIGRFKSQFSNKLVSMVPDNKHCEIFNNKSTAYRFAKDLNVPVPKKIIYENPNEIDKLISSANLKKVVIKMLTGNSGKGVIYATTPEDAKKKVIELIKKYKLKKERFPQIEEYVEGEGYGCSVLYWNGELITSFTHRRLRDKIKTGGTSTFRESTTHQDIEKAAKRIFNAIGWHGLAMCEFKVCNKTNKFWFIEVNPRMWGSMPLAINSGVEFPYLLYLCATKGPDAAKNYHQLSRIRNGWKARWLLGDIFVIVKELLSLNIKNVYKIIFMKRANSIDDFFFDDPLPFFGQIISYIKTSIKSKSLNPSEEGMVK